eukprot:TRINITY_DN5662_c0_g1_i1.p1 TRINITY_DN5662_c0_g1~~TRINITY_DN5662_c0_g1_i1.p1  ORF type:complete len:539 (+),score=59.19 TRINITY_DN5662_c0_g1_i1:138-1619(+)
MPAISAPERRQNRMKYGDVRKKRGQLERSGFTPFDPQSIPPGPACRRHKGVTVQPPRQDVPGMWGARGEITPRTSRRQNRDLKMGSPRRNLGPRRGCPFGVDRSLLFMDARLIDGDHAHIGDHHHDAARENYSARRSSRSAPPPERNPKSPGRGQCSRHNTSALVRSSSASPLLLGAMDRSAVSTSIRITEVGSQYNQTATERNLITGDGMTTEIRRGLKSPGRTREEGSGSIPALFRHEEPRSQRRSASVGHVARRSQLVDCGRVDGSAADYFNAPQSGRRSGYEGPPQGHSDPTPRGRAKNPARNMSSASLGRSYGSFHDGRHHAGESVASLAPFDASYSGPHPAAPEGSEPGTPFRRRMRGSWGSVQLPQMSVSHGLTPVGGADSHGGRHGGEYGTRSQSPARRAQAFDGSGAAWMDPLLKERVVGKSPARQWRSQGPHFSGSGLIHVMDQAVWATQADAKDGNPNRRHRSSYRPSSIVGPGIQIAEEEG